MQLSKIMVWTAGVLLGLMGIFSLQHIVVHDQAQTRADGGEMATPEIQLYLTDADPGVAGMPWEEAKDIFDRHSDELIALPGVNAVGLSMAGLSVDTDHPELVPKSIEGLPVRTRPRRDVRKSADLPPNDWWTEAAKARAENSR